MNNFEQLLNSENKSVKMFASTVKSFASCQGFYGRLIRDINDFNEYGLEQLKTDIKQQNFKDRLEVIMWLEG